MIRLQYLVTVLMGIDPSNYIKYLSIYEGTILEPGTTCSFDRCHKELERPKICDGGTFVLTSTIVLLLVRGVEISSAVFFPPF